MKRLIFTSTVILVLASATALAQDEAGNAASANRVFYDGNESTGGLPIATGSVDASGGAPAYHASGERRITVSDGTELFVRVRGNGIPCLYIHGGPGVGGHWMERLYGDVLERHFTMIYLDQRGSGRSTSAINGDYSPERVAKDLDEVRQGLGIDSWITFSHSFGGIIQMEHARLFPGTVRAMMMVAPTLDLGESIRGMIDFSLEALDINEDDRLSYLDQDRPLLDRMTEVFSKMRKEGLFWKLHYADPENYDRMDAIMAEVSSPNTEFANEALGLARYYESYKPLATTLTMPVLLYYGKKDYAVGPEHHEDIRFPNMTLESWDGGHVPFMEGERELEQAITQWLATLH